MSTEKSFLSGFLVLGFVLVIAGFLLGMLAIALIGLKPDFTTLGFMLFTFGFIAGMITVALTLFIVKFSKLRKKPT